MVADAAVSLGGKLYVHGGGWDALLMREFPATHPTMALALILAADATEAPGTGELRVQLVDDDGVDTGIGAAANLGLGLSPLYKPGQKTLAPIALSLANLRFEKPGQYEFRIFWNGRQLNPSVSFSVASPPPLSSFSQSAQE